MSPASISAPPSSLVYLTTHSNFLYRRHNISILTFPLNPRNLQISATFDTRNLELSSFSPSYDASDDFNGWAFIENSLPAKHSKKKGLSTFVVRGIGTSIAVLLALIASLSFSRKGSGFKLHLGSPFKILYQTKTNDSEMDSRVVKETPGIVPESIRFSSEKRPFLPATLDCTQHEALSLLKKLKIMEDTERGDELCSRREYARWLVRLNSLLERNPKRKIFPSILLSGSVTTAFHDVDNEDPDFASIQSLAEAGVVPSELSAKSSDPDSSERQHHFYFHPERFISRRDLISWRAQLEYEFIPGFPEQISRMKVCYMDLKDISSNEAPEIYMDMLAEHKGIIRKVFGKSRRLQPCKPSTKAQAAVALTSGRMFEAAHEEISRLEAEMSARLTEMEEITKELLDDRGFMRSFWNEKLNVEKKRGSDVENVYLQTVSDLDQEKIVQDKFFAEKFKENAAMDCQIQLILNLKKDVDDMLEKLASERSIHVAEKCNVQKMLTELQTGHEGLLNSKSTLEAEKEALEILRSWVEDEAKKSQASAKVLEEVRRRWEWDDQS